MSRIYKKRKPRQRWNEYNMENSDTPVNVGASTSHASVSAVSNKDIPGFYFDEEKQRYFRISSDTNNVHCYTKDNIAKASQEAERKANLLKKGCSQTSNSYGIFTNINSRFQNEIHPYQYRFKTCQSVFSNLQLSGSTDVCPSPSNTIDEFEHMEKWIHSSPNTFICLWSLQTVLAQKIQTLVVKEFKNVEEEGETSKCTVCVQPVGASLVSSLHKVTSLCYVPVVKYKHRSALNNSLLLYTTICVTGVASSYVKLRTLGVDDMAGYFLDDFCMGRYALWCCAWNPKTEQFSVGSEKNALIVNAESRQMWELSTNGTDVYTQEFSEDGFGLYSGTKRGSILLHDLRSRSTQHVQKWEHTAGVCCVRLSSSGYYIFANDFSGQIKKWDIRSSSCLTTYIGSKNEYRMIPFHLQESLGILCAAGSDAYTHIWDINSGQVLNKIPPPVNPNNQVPTVFISDAMSVRTPTPGLLMGLHDKIFWFSL